MTDRRDEAREVFAHRDDPDEWDDQPEQIEVAPARSEVVSFRLPSEELDSLEEAASRAGESLSEYIRTALAVRLHGQPIGPSVEVSSGAHRLTIRSHIVVSSRTDAPQSIVPDLPPMTQSVGA
jgi:hypothetical protein